MALSNTAFIRWTAILLLGGLVTLLGIVGLTFWLSVRTADISQNIAVTRSMRAATVELRSLLQDAETGQRGYLLTREAPYLEPYNAAIAGLTAGLTQLSGLIPDAEQPHFARLETVIRAKMAELEQTITLERTGRYEEALALVKTDVGKNLMDEARGIFAALLTGADGHLQQSMTAQTSSIINLQRSVIAGAIFIIFVVGTSAVIAMRYTRELLAARAELATLNLDLEHRVDERTAELGRANSELQRFAYFVGHDLRAPLVNVMGFTSELTQIRQQIFGVITDLREKTGASANETDRELEKDFDESIEFIRTSTSKMDGLINAILKLSREGKRQLTPERLDLGALLSVAAANVQHRVQERNGSIAVESPIPNIVSDRFSLEQVFGNLFDNASKYAHADRPPEIVARAIPMGDQIQIDVVDNGRGIGPTEYERVFELFRRVGQQDQRGEGIGLASVRAQVRRLGGDVTVTSELGKGSTFHVRLPRVLTQEAAAG